MTSNYKRLGDYIEPIDERNTKGKVKLSQGISNNKYFQNPKQVAVNSANDNIVRTGYFAYNRATTRNGEKISIALREGEDCTVSSAYQVFKIKDEEKLDSRYLMMWFRRPEFDRYARFKSHGSAHEFFEFEQMCDVMLPVPSIDRQRELVAQYEALSRRIRINEQMIATLEDTAQALYRKMFVEGIDKENLPEGWRMGTLGELAEFVAAGVIPSYSDTSSMVVLGQRCTKKHQLDLSLARHHVPKKNCTFLKSGDILINSTGAGTLGRAGQKFIMPDNLAFDSNMTLVRPLKDTYATYLGTAIFGLEEYFVQISQGSTNQTRLYCSMVKPVEIIIPSDDIMEIFTTNVKPIRVYNELLIEENIILEHTKSLLLSTMLDYK